MQALGMVVYGFANNTATAPQPYAPEDIIIVNTNATSFIHYLLTLTSLPTHIATLLAHSSSR